MYPSDIYIHICLYIYIYIYIYTHTHTYIHTYIHAYIRRLMEQSSLGAQHTKHQLRKITTLLREKERHKSRPSTGTQIPNEDNNNSSTDKKDKSQTHTGLLQSGSSEAGCVNEDENQEEGVVWLSDACLVSDIGAALLSRYIHVCVCILIYVHTNT
jgi:hypothetical protein